MADDYDDIDAQLDSMRERAADCIAPCLFTTGIQRFGELARQAKSHQRVIPYVLARFHQMDMAQYVFDFDLMRDNAIELIALMEDEEHARKFEPALPVEEYEYHGSWMTACLYENLAEAIGQSDGYNSDGMHQCIADGLEVCHRTGKLACLSCFREYATDVYCAADDAFIAKQQCHSILAREGGWSDRGDRRWYAAIKLGWIELLEGRLDQAEAQLRAAQELSQAEEVSVAREAWLRATVELNTILILRGEQPVDMRVDGFPANPPPTGEWGVFDWREELNAATQACVVRDFQQAIEILTRWDQKLGRLPALHHWFENRLRLTAATALNGDTDRAGRLADQLEAKAQLTRDFLTLSRLAVLRSLEPHRVNPLATLQPFNAGPFGDSSAAAEPETVLASDAVPPNGATTATVEPDSDPEDEALSPLRERLMSYVERYSNCESAEEADAVLEEYLRLTPSEFEDARDVITALGLVRLLSSHSQSAAAVWAWAEQFRAAWPDEPSVLNSVGTVGAALLFGPDKNAGELTTFEELDKLFHATLAMAPDRFGNHMRAGEYFADRNNVGEAERCFARAFRLDRANSHAAEALAEVYAGSGRPLDALGVIDECLRTGSREPGLLWKASVLALDHERYQSVLTYLEAFEEAAPEQQWLNYYRAQALLGLRRFDDVLTAVDAERQYEHESPLPLDALTACAQFALDHPAAKASLQAAIDTPLRSCPSMTVTGLRVLMEKLWQFTASALPAGDADRRRLESLLLSAGLAPDEYFNAVHEQSLDQGDEPEMAEDDETVLVRCLIRQPLGDDWAQSPGCLCGQESWTEYVAEWNALARGPDEAEELAMKWQSRVARPSDGDGEVVHLEPLAGPFNDLPHVVEQLPHWVLPDDVEDDEEIEE